MSFVAAFHPEKRIDRHCSLNGRFWGAAMVWMSSVTTVFGQVAPAGGGHGGDGRKGRSWKAVSDEFSHHFVTMVLTIAPCLIATSF
jgi:hypothetical protein